MRELVGAVLSVALPWVVGAIWVRALWRKASGHRALLCIGYGYLIGAFATTLLMRLVGAVGQRWSFTWIAGLLLALGCAGWFAAKPLPSPRAEWRHSVASFADLPQTTHRLFRLFLALCAINTVAIACYVAWSLLLPYDAMAQWADKARVWYEFGRTMPFIDSLAWRKLGDPLTFWDPNPSYPATLPLLQVWTALAVGHWDESLINLHWVAAFVALGFAFYAQVRRLGTGPATTMAATYLLLSLPFLQIHVAVAGMADIFVAITYGLAAISFWQWTMHRQWQDAVLAVVMAMLCVALKNEGILWALTLVPAVIVALHRRLGFAAVALVGAAAILYLAFGPDDIKFMNYTLHTKLVNVTLPVYQHLFMMDNWHLLWYAAIALVAFNWRVLFGPTLAPMTVTMLAATGLVFVVFFFSSAAVGVDEESLVNRFLLHEVPALAYYLMLILREREASAAELAAPRITAEPAG